MHITTMTVSLSLPGCRSLKEKRQRVGGLHERLGRNPNIAVCESGQRNAPDSGEWTFVVTGMTKGDVEALCASIEDKLHSRVDGYLLDILRERL